MSLRTPQELVIFLVAAGYSQAVIAERAGVKQPTISRILSGEHDDPKSSVLIRLNEFADEVAVQVLPPATRRATDALPPMAPDRPRRQLPDGKNVMSFADQPATLEKPRP